MLSLESPLISTMHYPQFHLLGTPAKVLLLYESGCPGLALGSQPHLTSPISAATLADKLSLVFHRRVTRYVILDTESLSFSLKYLGGTSTVTACYLTTILINVTLDSGACAYINNHGTYRYSIRVSYQLVTLLSKSPRTKSCA